MKILKFGGTSVGSAQALKNLKEIVSERKSSSDGIAVVVSALGGVTDSLLNMCRLAAGSDSAFLDEFNALSRRHLDLSDEMFAGRSQQVKDMLEPLLGELKIKIKSVATLGVLPQKTEMEIVSYGERLSSIIVSALLEGSVLMDSFSLIKTRKIQGRNIPDTALSEKLIRKAFEGFDRKGGSVAVLQGFISQDSESGCTTNLGRGGSDYTASILAAALDADCLEIWTDVDGFMTADPRIIRTSYVIDTLSFADAMELCNCGAKVLCPTSLYPVRSKNIPILIKNTFNPSAKGTVIRSESGSSSRCVTGISSIADCCLLTVSGPSMAGIVGVDSRIFTALAKESISVFMVSQSSSETSISLGVGADVADKARSLLREEFAHEISSGSMNDIECIDGVSTVAIVGERIKDDPSVTGRLFSVLGRNGIRVISCTQGSECRNISIVVEKKFLKKSLNVLHDSFFLSVYQELNLFICGTGTVGGNLVEQIASQRDTLMKENHLKLNIVGIAKSDRAIFCRDGLQLDGWRDRLMEAPKTDVQGIRDEVLGMNIFNAVFVDCTPSPQVASLYKDFFEHGISVVAANKTAASSDYSNYLMLKNLSAGRNVKFLFETNVGAGLPIINTINALKNSGDRILRLEAVLSGTLNFIFNTISAEIPFSRAVKMALEQGYSEPDPRVDLSGTDAIRKIVILAREAGYAVNISDVKSSPFIPESLMDCTLEEFWKRLPSVDGMLEERRRRLEAGQKRLRMVATMDEGGLSLALKESSKGDAFYELESTNNIILITTQRYNRHPMLIQGYGAGAQVTAAGVFADIMSVANV